MRIPGPYSDDTWDWLPRERGANQRKFVSHNHNNKPSRVLWELGLALLVPVLGVGVVELVLSALHVY
jgi:hypothetical protein